MVGPSYAPQNYTKRPTLARIVAFAVVIQALPKCSEIDWQDRCWRADVSTSSVIREMSGWQVYRCMVSAARRGENRHEGNGPMRNLTFITLAAAVVSATIGTAQANSWGSPCTSAPESEWLPPRELQAKVEAQGYIIHKAKLKNACGEFYTTDKAGTKVEVFVDPTNGKIVGKL